MSSLWIRRTVLFVLLGLVGLLILLAVFFVGSLVADWLYYAITQRLALPPLPLPGPTGSPSLGIDGLVEILLYVLIILTALGVILATIISLRKLGGGSAPQPRHDRDQLQPGAS